MRNASDSDGAGYWGKLNERISGHSGLTPKVSHKERSEWSAPTKNGEPIGFVGVRLTVW